MRIPSLPSHINFPKSTLSDIIIQKISEIKAKGATISIGTWTTWCGRSGSRSRQPRSSVNASACYRVEGIRQPPPEAGARTAARPTCMGDKLELDEN
ncbi:uncharacterized protein [Lolium perenne]